MVDFAALSDTALAQRISYNAEQRLLHLVGILSPADKAALDAISADASYRNAVNGLFTQPTVGMFPPEQLWLQDADLALPLRDPDPAADNLARNLGTAVRKGLAYLAKTRAEGPGSPAVGSATRDNGNAHATVAHRVRDAPSDAARTPHRAIRRHSWRG